MSDVGSVFAALADPTRRKMLTALIEDGSTTVPTLTNRLPISRQAVAKHVSVLNEAGLIERAPGADGRTVSYRLSREGLSEASAWIRATEAAWDGRLSRLKRSVETRGR